MIMPVLAGFRLSTLRTEKQGLEVADGMEGSGTREEALTWRSRSRAVSNRPAAQGAGGTALQTWPQLPERCSAIRADGWRESEWRQFEQRGLQGKGDLNPRLSVLGCYLVKLDRSPGRRSWAVRPGG